jgi:hypothetical protein
MKRRYLGIAAAAAALGSVVALAPATPAQSDELVHICITIEQKSVGIKLNGTPIGIKIPAVERTCGGI